MDYLVQINYPVRMDYLFRTDYLVRMDYLIRMDLHICSNGLLYLIICPTGLYTYTIYFYDN